MVGGDSRSENLPWIYATITGVGGHDRIDPFR